MIESSIWEGSTSLVTGATGLVGSWLVRGLMARGSRVVALVHDADPQSELFRSGDATRVAVVNGSLDEADCIERTINKHGVDTVFHLGAQALVGAALRSPVATFDVNVRGTYLLLDACRRNPSLVKRVIVASSDKAYGEQASLPYTEDMPLLARNPYDVSKACADLLAQSYHHTYGLPVAIARCGNIYGGGDLNWSRVVPGTIRSVLHGERPVLRSDGTFVRDYLHVLDAVSAYIALAEQMSAPGVAGQPFNFSAESPVDVLGVVAQIQELAGTHLEPLILNQAVSEIQSQHLSAAKAHAILGWKAQRGLTAGLTTTLTWYRAFLGQ